MNRTTHTYDQLSRLFIDATSPVLCAFVGIIINHNEVETVNLLMGYKANDYVKWIKKLADLLVRKDTDVYYATIWFKDGSWIGVEKDAPIGESSFKHYKTPIIPDELILKGVSYE